MPSTESDLRYIAAGIEQLESYLLSNEVYWPISAQAPPGETPFPPLTLGNLLIARQRARASAVSPSQQVELNRLEERLEDLRGKWRSAWSRKAEAEFGARLLLWRNFLTEYRQSPGENYDRYGYEVGRRVMLALLSEEAEEVPPAERDMLASLDALLRGVFKPGDFIWDEDLIEGFPQEVYWYLYGMISEDFY